MLGERPPEVSLGSCLGTAQKVHCTAHVTQRSNWCDVACSTPVSDLCLSCCYELEGHTELQGFVRFS